MRIKPYFAAIAAERPEANRSNLAFYLQYLFKGVRLEGARVLDVGAGDGLYSLWAAAAGAHQVVALEPQAAGSSDGAPRRFRRALERLSADAVELRSETLQELDPGLGPFDVVLLHSSINHLDEAACMELGREPWAREAYAALLGKLAALTAPRGTLIVVDASSRNLFARLPLRNPVAPDIEWQKHQPPRLWSELLTEAGFEQPRVRWNSFNTLRGPGRLLLGNRAAAWLTQSVFCLTMTRSAPPGSRSPS